MLVPALFWLIGAATPFFYCKWFIGSDIGKKKRALWWGAGLSVISALLNLLIAVSHHKEHLDAYKPWIKFLLPISMLLQGTAYMAVYNGTYLFYAQSRPIVLRYFQNSESGILLFCCVFYLFVNYNFDTCTIALESICLGVSCAGFLAAILIRWEHID
jgi:hypothetical protein